MAFQMKWYASGLLKALNKEIDYDTDTIKVMLTTSAYTPDRAAHAYKSSVTNEVTGTGYTAGGATLASKTIAYTAANSWTTQRANSTAYVVGDIVRPAVANGYLYQCVAAGTSNGSPPAFPTTIGTTVADGTATWLNVGIGIIVLDAADVTWSTSTITARQCVVYDDTGNAATSALLGVGDFGGDQVSSSGNFNITWDADGGVLAIFAV